MKIIYLYLDCCFLFTSLYLLISPGVKNAKPRLASISNNNKTPPNR
jgi:hypothetical protein